MSVDEFEPLRWEDVTIRRATDEELRAAGLDPALVAERRLVDRLVGYGMTEAEAEAAVAARRLVGEIPDYVKREPGE